MDIREEYEARFALSADWARRANIVLAGGCTHDAWRLEPFPVVLESACGAYKRTAEGHRLIDYWMGHGALLFGHGYPPVVDAICRQAAHGVQFGGPHGLQTRWAELVCSLVPGAERVRFTASGTEATLLSFRTARAVTGRNVILRIDGHFHGWHDHALAHSVPSESSGISTLSVDEVAIAEFGSLDHVAELLDESVAGVILEPGGGAAGALPWTAEFLTELRQLTCSNGSLLIFDETGSGFRYAPGGVQSLCGTTPDLTILGKILCGGLPGGAVAGLAGAMGAFGPGTTRDGRSIRIPHSGTCNANALSAAAGVVTLENVANGAPQALVTQMAARLVAEVNESAASTGVDVRLYQEAGIFHVVIGALAAGYPIGPSVGALVLVQQHSSSYECFRRALLLEGVDSHAVHGWVSTAHDSEVVDETVRAYTRAFERVKREDGFPTMA